MIPAVGYLRVSTEEQNGPGTFSMERQRTTIEQRASRDNCEVVRWFQDVDSGEKLSREGYQSMLGFLRRKEADRVYIWESSRLGRNDREFLRCCWELEDLGIDVVSCTQDLKNVLLRYIYAWKANEDNRELGRRVAAGKKTAAEKGLWLGPVPFGYMRAADDRQLVPDPQRAGTVLLIFERYAAGRPMHAICTELTRGGVSTIGGEPWQTGTIQKMLRRDVYAGHTTNRYVTKKNTHEPLVPQDLFDMVQGIVRKSYHRGKGYASPHLLSGVLCCGYCGHKMYGLLDKRRPKWSVYQCGAWRARRECQSNLVKTSVAEELVVSEVRELMDPAVFNDERDKRNTERSRQLEPRIKNVRKRLAEADKRLQRAWDLVLAGAASVDEFAAQKARLLEEKVALQGEMADLEVRSAQSEADERRADEMALALDTMNRRWDQATVAERKALLGALIERATVKGGEGKIEIQYRF